MKQVSKRQLTPVLEQESQKKTEFWPRMYLVTVLLSVSVTLGNADVISVFDVPPIDPDCKPPDVCATLYFYDAAGQPLGALQGTEKALKGMKNVAKVKQVGMGSYTVFKGKNHRLKTVELNKIVLILSTRSLSSCLRGNDMIDLKTQAYYQATVVKYVWLANL